MSWRSGRFWSCFFLGMLGFSISGQAMESVTTHPLVFFLKPWVNLGEVIARSPPGSVLHLAPGLYHGPVVIDRPLTLAGTEGVVVDGGGVGSVLTLTADHVTVRHLTIRNSGTDLSTFDSGILVLAQAGDARIEANHLEGNLFGVYLKGVENAWVRNNRIEGRDDLRLASKGDGVSMWNVHGARVEENVVTRVRDGIFINVSQRNHLKGNIFFNLRFAIHYMYSHDNEVSGNLSRDNDVGFALMFSDRLKVFGNRSVGDRYNGLLFNFTNKSKVHDNRVDPGPEKCLFVYNSSFNEITGNRLRGCGVGIHFTAGSQDNQIVGNAFMGNQVQVKYVGTRYHEWSREGRGNYWSDNPAFDLNGDGIGDAAYRPNDLMDQVVWRHPLAKLLLTSPAVQTLRAVQNRFPALLPGGVVDSFPLMEAPD